MSGTDYQISVSLGGSERVLEMGVIALLAVFWTLLQLEPVDPIYAGFRAVIASVLILVAPGLLLASVLRLGDRTIGELLVFTAGLSLASVSALVTALAITLPLVGIEQPLTELPLISGLSVLLLALTAASYRSKTRSVRPRVEVQGPFWFLLALTLLPTLAAVGAIVQGRYGTNAGMALLIITIVGAVIATATRYVPSELYPLTLFSITVSALLHRNLLTDQVVGADIQLNYFISNLVLQANQWSPELGGSMISLPVVSSVPASFTILTGIGLATTYKIVYTVLFATVPVGIYYLGREYFDERVALFGTYFFVFYHISFYFTPGKQLISELFVVLILLVLFRGYATAWRGKLGVLLLSIGLIHTHYGMAFVFGGSLLIAYIGVRVCERVVGEMDHELTLWYPLSFLGMASGWYAYASRELILRIFAVPISLIDQIVLLLEGAILVSSGSGASFIYGQSAILQYVPIAIYALFTLLIALGIAWQFVTILGRAWKGERPGRLELTALAIPLFVFLTSTYFIQFSLWADRVYQMVLPVIAPFMGYGFLLVRNGISRVTRRWTLRWGHLAILVSLLLVFNSGFAFALFSTAQDPPFNADAHDLTFYGSEVAGGEWVKSYTDTPRIQPAERYVLADIPQNESAMTRIYIDRYTYQMFRSLLPQEYHGVEYVYLRSEWRTQLDTDELNNGYVIVRRRGVVTSTDARPIPVAYLRDRQATTITERGNVIYANEDLSVTLIEDRLVDDDNETAATRPQGRVSAPILLP